MATNLRQREIGAGAPKRAGDTQKQGRLTIPCVQLWSFVDHKGHKQLVWLAIDAHTRELVGVDIGAREQVAARKLWASWPPVARQCAIAYTDFWAADAAVLASQRHRAVGKQTGITSYMERFHKTLRQRVSRLVRKTLSCIQVLRESHRCHLLFHPSLQCIITCVALPFISAKFWR